ncbi:MAG TPA: T9SS type A sorting domain-containing protein [candidate division Zixibacteria bacterium]|nr:T9SS type A sorting domain-containing protein [candidate division Zixibacteria bacterium]
MKLTIKWIPVVIILFFAGALSAVEWIPEEVRFHHVLELGEGGTVFESGYGRVAISYTPEPDGFFVNVVALDSDFMPAWIVRNLWLPSSSWIADQQTISSRFPLYLLFPDVDPDMGYDFTYAIYGIVRTPHTLGSMPPIVEYNEAFAQILVEDIGDGALFDEEIDPPPDEVPPFPDYEDGDVIEEEEFRGCRVPNIDLDSESHPPTPDYAGDKNACAVASTANSFMWLKDVYDDIDFDLSHRELLELLSSLMGRAPASGVTSAQMIRGKLDLIEMLGLNINVKFQNEFYDTNIQSSSGATVAQCQNTGPYPTWEWLQAELEAGEDVELNYRWIDAEGNDRGHSVVITGTETTPGGARRIKFKHDINQGGESSDDELEHADEGIYIDDYGRMRLPGRRNAVVSSVVSESPGEPFLGIGDAGKLPDRFAISTYPNPFNSAVTITIDGVGARHELPIQVEIYDVSGRIVENISVGEGPRAFPLDGNSENGSAQGRSLTTREFIWQPDENLPSGVYLVRATASGGQTAARRVVYLK